MTTSRRKFSDEQKLEILNQAEKLGISNVLRNHSLSYSVYVKWKQKFTKADPESQVNALSNKAKTEIRQLTEQNQRLKKIIADLALQMELKDEELKKCYSSFSKR